MICSRLNVIQLWTYKTANLKWSNLDNDVFVIFPKLNKWSTLSGVCINNQTTECAGQATKVYRWVYYKSKNSMYIQYKN